MTVLDKLIVRGRSVLRMHDAAETNTAGVPDGTLRLHNDGTNSFIQVYSRATGTWDTLSPDAVAAALYAPIAADYLVGTTNGTLTGEIVAGTAPGGELGGTWGTPTVDATHAGSAHHAEAHTVPSHTGTPGGELGGTWTSPTVDATHSGSAHHDQSHTVVSHSDTSATGAELNTLTDGSNADALHAHAGGWTLVHSDNTGGSTSSTTEADIVDITGLSIPALHGIRVEFNTRLDNNEGGVRTGQIGLHLNGASVLASVASLGGENTTLDTSGHIIFEIPARSTAMDRGGFYRGVYYNGSAMVYAEGAISQDGALPVATVTSITIRGDVNAATDVTLHVDNIRVWELAD